MNLNTQTKLKILFITSDKYPPYRVDVSVLFGKEIVGRGHIIDGIFQSEEPLRRPIELNGRVVGSWLVLHTAGPQ